MSLQAKLFSELSKSEISDLTKAKSAMSTRYLSGRIAVRGLARAFRAESTAASTHNVVGVGIDEKYVEGVPTGINAIKFLVRTKVPPTALSNKEKLPESIDGIPTDVEEVGLIVPLASRAKKTSSAAASTTPNPRTRMRPAQPGSSVGFREPNDLFIMAGTFGALVKDSQGNLYVLSNNHVLAFESGVEADGVTRREALPPGAPIFQPGLLDNGKVATDQIAELSRWIDLRADRDDNTVDGAIAKLKNASSASRDILFIGAPTGTKTAERT